MTGPQFFPGKACTKADVHDTLGGQAENIESYTKIIHIRYSFLSLLVSDIVTDPVSYLFNNISFTAKEQHEVKKASVGALFGYWVIYKKRGV